METRSNYVMVGAVTVALLAGVLLFIVWLAGLSNKATKCYDIYFAQGVEIVSNQEHREIEALLERADQLIERRSSDRIEARRRLVEEQKLRVEG